MPIGHRPLRVVAVSVPTAAAAAAVSVPTAAAAAAPLAPLAIQAETTTWMQDLLHKLAQCTPACSTKAANATSTNT